MRPLGTIDRGQMQVCYPLQEDPELLEAIEPDQRAAASTALTARQLDLSPGAWPGSSAGRDGIGLLVLQGTLVLRVGIAGRHSAELIGEGDVLRRPDNGWATQLTLTHSWLVLEPARLAVLDSRFASQLAGFPNLAGALFGRASLRTRQLAVNMAIVHQARVDVRLHMLLWHLAGRWGRVRSDGIVVALRLTHSILAELVAARRPTVTSALSELSRNGLVRSVPEGWLLCGPPPGAPDELDLALADEPTGTDDGGDDVIGTA
jgi:CRP/FNR family transcriptional regulator, cyclic AMP receptor protein